jgi:hypothetical protein
VNTQIRDIRTANSTASSFISEALPMTMAGTDAAGRPFAKDVFVTLYGGTSDDLKKKMEDQKPFSSIKRSE